MNQADSAYLSGRLGETGHRKTEDLEEAQVIIFNTCSVRQHAEERLFQNLKALRPLKEKKPERLFVFENAMAINRVDSSGYFNQLKGTTINALFTDGKISSMRAKGNAGNVYYATDEEKRFIGVNKSSADVIDVFFEDSKPQRVVFLRNLEGMSYPMRQVNHDELKLRNFKWLADKRPKTKFDILSN